MHDPRQQLISASTRNPAAKRWLDRTAELLASYSCDVHGPEYEVHPLDEQLVYSAAWQLWQARGKKACWSKLDVHQLIHRLAHGASSDDMVQSHFVVILRAFYCFLAKFGHLRQRQARRVFKQLRPWWQQAYCDMMVHLALSGGPESQPSKVTEMAQPELALN